ncbi:hypothetical protein [Peptostreptococcus sp. D1]|uniref:hypothetical protein n=1 Tax=Peptostreptococcus sp. D1 TaxID=72304 RepID=UPI0008F2C3AB|nr:hypothetical protein [Peptostreptococcus sp. D1]SFE88484.1 hypothetical protein SAMN02910278_01966 [Peptostreptococcus sp. D1]
MKIDGIDNFINTLEQLSNNAKDLSSTTSINLEDAFTESFMSTHTKFNDFQSFLESGGFKASNQEEFDSIDTDKLDEYVSQNTSFNSFEDMLTEATMPHLEEILFKNI